MAAQVFVTPFMSPLILLKIAMEPIRSANRMVTAPREADNLSLSIKEMATMAAARIPMRRQS